MLNIIGIVTSAILMVLGIMLWVVGDVKSKNYIVNIIGLLIGIASCFMMHYAAQY